MAHSFVSMDLCYYCRYVVSAIWCQYLPPTTLRAGYPIRFPCHVSFIAYDRNNFHSGDHHTSKDLHLVLMNLNGAHFHREGLCKEGSNTAGRAHSHFVCSGYSIVWDQLAHKDVECKQVWMQTSCRSAQSVYMFSFDLRGTFRIRVEAVSGSANSLNAKHIIWLDSGRNC